MKVRAEGVASAALPVIRWMARVLATLLVAMVVMFLVGEGVDPAALRPVDWTGMAALALLCAGLLLGWKREVAGGGLALAGLAAMYAIEVAVNGHPLRGWTWPMLRRSWLFHTRTARISPMAPSRRACIAVMACCELRVCVPTCNTRRWRRAASIISRPSRML